MLPQIPEMTLTGSIPLDPPLATLLIVALLATIALALLTEDRLGGALRALLPTRSRAERSPRRAVVTITPRS